MPLAGVMASSRALEEAGEARWSRLAATDVMALAVVLEKSSGVASVMAKGKCGKSVHKRNMADEKFCGENAMISLDAQICIRIFRLFASNKAYSSTPPHLPSSCPVHAILDEMTDMIREMYPYHGYRTLSEKTALLIGLADMFAAANQHEGHQ